MTENRENSKINYQLATFKPLIYTKMYFTTREEVKAHLRKCVSMTNKFRVQWNMKELTGKQISESVRLLKIDFMAHENIQSWVGVQKELAVPTLTDYYDLPGTA